MALSESGRYYAAEDLITQILDTIEQPENPPTDDWMQPSVDIGVESVIGSREEQQDAVITSSYKDYDQDKRMIAVLCDGMGGLSGGAKVSRYCSEMMYQSFNAMKAAESYHDFFSNVLYKLDREVKAMTCDGSKPLGGGSTLVSAIIQNGTLSWASVGDSRMYMVRQGKLLQITRDHNFLSILMERVGRGQMTVEEALAHPKREALISFIGMGGLRIVDAIEQPMQLLAGDYLVMCSDGVYRGITDIEMVQALYENEFCMQKAAEQMVQTVLNKNIRGQDNASVIAIRYL